MVTADTRNNIIVIVVLIAIAVLIAGFMYVFSTSLLEVARHGENTVNLVGKSVAGNISNATETNSVNLLQFNRSMTDVVKSTNNQTKYLVQFNNNSLMNRNVFTQLLDEHMKTNKLLAEISKKLDIVPITPIVPTPINNTQPKNCMIKTPTVCILPNGGGIIINH